MNPFHINEPLLETTMGTIQLSSNMMDLVGADEK